MDKKLNVIYEDNHVIVVVKPANILSQADITGDIDMLTIIKKYIKEKYNKPGNVYLGLVHRLDRPTSGLMVFANTITPPVGLSNLCTSPKYTSPGLLYFSFMYFLTNVSISSSPVLSACDGIFTGFSTTII